MWCLHIVLIMFIFLSFTENMIIKYTFTCFTFEIISILLLTWSTLRILYWCCTTPGRRRIKQYQICLYNTSHIYIIINLCQHFFLTFLYLFLFKCWHRLNEPVKDIVIYNQELYVIILLYSIYSVLMYFEIEKKNE